MIKQQNLNYNTSHRNSSVQTRQLKDKNGRIPDLEQVTLKTSKPVNVESKNSKIDESKELKLNSIRLDAIKQNDSYTNHINDENNITYKGLKKDNFNDNSYSKLQNLDGDYNIKETIFKDEKLPPMAFNNQSDFTEDNKKLMFDTLKFFYSIQNQNKNNLTIKNNDLDKVKLIEELREKTEGFEKENYYLKKNFEDKEKIYSEKIKFLENQLQFSSKSDIILLQKQNREYEEHVNDLNKRIQLMNKNNEIEKEKFNSVVTEIMTLKSKLAEDIQAVEILTKELANEQYIFNKFREAVEKRGKKNDKDKIEIVLKYDKSKDNDKGSMVIDDGNSSHVYYNKSISMNNSNQNIQNNSKNPQVKSMNSLVHSNIEMKKSNDVIPMRRLSTDKDKNIYKN